MRIDHCLLFIKSSYITKVDGNFKRTSRKYFANLQFNPNRCTCTTQNDWMSEAYKPNGNDSFNSIKFLVLTRVPQLFHLLISSCSRFNQNASALEIRRQFGYWGEKKPRTISSQRKPENIPGIFYHVDDDEYHDPLL